MIGWFIKLSVSVLMDVEYAWILFSLSFIGQFVHPVVREGMERWLFWPATSLTSLEYWIIW